MFNLSAVLPNAAFAGPAWKLVMPSCHIEQALLLEPLHSACLSGVLVSMDALVLVCFLQMMLSMRHLSAGGRAASPDVSGLEVLQSTQQAQSCCKGIHWYVDANKLLLKAALVVCYGNRFSLCVTSRNSGAVTKHR